MVSVFGVKTQSDLIAGRNYQITIFSDDRAINMPGFEHNKYLQIQDKYLQIQVEMGAKMALTILSILLKLTFFGSSNWED